MRMDKMLTMYATDNLSLCVCVSVSVWDCSDLSLCITEVKSYSIQGKCDVQAETYSASLDDT